MSTGSLVAPRPITADEFRYVSELLYRHTGVTLSTGKEALVMGRLDRRLRQLGMGSYGEYLRLLRMPDQQRELRYLVDRLTTNETFFFREGHHFAFMRDTILPERDHSRPFRLWSAASSTGEEAFTAAMVLAETLHGAPWEIVGTDVSSSVVRTAQRGVYPLSAAEKIPAPLLRRFCRKGRDEYAGLMAMAPDLRARVTFLNANLLESQPGLGRFDVILLRNVMIYFDTDTKHALVARLEDMLHPGGYLIVSHSESLNGFPSRLRMVEPSIYRTDGDSRD